MRLFHESNLRDVLENRKANLKQEIESQEHNYLLNANETQLATHFANKYRIAPLVLYEDKVYATDQEAIVPAEQFDTFLGEACRRQVVRFHISFTGDSDLLKCMPSRGLPWTQDVPVENAEVCFDVTVRSDDPAEVKQDWESFLESLRTQVGYSTTEINEFNSRLEQEVAEMIQGWKNELLKRGNFLGSLNVPLEKASEVPSTFADPTPKKKVIVAKPSASTSPFVPEPTLDEDAYNDILKIIHDAGVELELHPSIYEGKDEETLRDHLLMVLASHFDSVTGETFNKTGKTDILIPHEGKNIFVAECGIWQEAKQFFGKIDQLLSCLTWRDSKTALICFVRNKEFGSVLETIKTETPKHSAFVKDQRCVCDGWLRYEFSLKDDPSRKAQLAILCFHFP
jgi:hypothetical protein